MDILKIIANTYFSEGQGAYKIDHDELGRILEELARRQKTPSYAPTLDDLEDYKEYVDSISQHLASGEELNRVFWPSAIDLAQNLEIEERAILYSFIWGRLEEFTKLYVTLYKALAQLGFPETAFTSIKAIYEEEIKPDGRLNSVLHVDRLLGILSEEGGNTIPVISKEGKRAELPRPVLCALISELHAKVKESPGDFMSNADILDFPGYRSRSKYENFKEAIKKPDEIKNCFIRGKVAYVFQRYSKNKEITIMLLCIKDSNMEIADLPEVVNAWINDTHGSTPEERWGKPICLFMVLTFFNVHFQRGEGEADLTKIWDNRLIASISQPFDKSDWPKNWARQGRTVVPFSNSFWLLNVYRSINFLNVTSVSLDTGDEVLLKPNQLAGDEDVNTAYIAKGVREEMEGWLNSLRDAHHKSSLVQSFFKEPEEAWEGVVLSEDGGCSYIISKLIPILRVDLKTAQLQSLALKEGKDIFDTLSYFYQGGSTAEELKLKRTLFARIDNTLTMLGNPGNMDRVQALLEGTPWHRFGILLRDLTFSDDECYEIFTRPESIPLPKKVSELAELQDDKEIKKSQLDDNAPSEEDILGRFGRNKQKAPAAPVEQVVKRSSPDDNRGDDKARYCSRLLDTEWQANLERIANNPYKLRYYGFNPKDLKALILELKSGAKRLGVMTHIEDEIRKACRYSNVNQESIMWILARIASAILSEVVNFLGFSPRTLPDSEKRTVTIESETFTLFEPPVIEGEYPVLPDLPPAYEMSYHNDWRVALYHIMVDNVYFAEATYNVRENDRLGTIRSKVEKNNKNLSSGKDGQNEAQIVADLQLV
jgi:hypothetical protein